MIWLGAAENAPNARETLCPGCPSLASPFLEIKIPNQSTCTTVPGQFKKKTFPTQNLKTEKAHLEKGDLNISFCGRQDVDITHNRQSLFFLTQGIHAALTHKPGSRHAASFLSSSQLKNWGLEEDLLLCPTKHSGKAEGEAKLSPLN